jgi:hypothetical protein
VRRPRRGGRRRPAAAANVQHALPRRDRRGAEQARKQVPVPGQVPFTVGYPVPAALAVPPLRLCRVSCTAHFTLPGCRPTAPAAGQDRRPAGSHGLVMHVLRYQGQSCADRQHDDREQQAER